MVRKGLHVTMATAAFSLLLGLVGCSDNPVAPMKTSVQSGQDDFTEKLPGSQIELSGRVTSTDGIAHSLTITSQALTVLVAEGAEIVFKDGGNETPILFSQIAVSDSIEVRGDVAGSSLLANRVRIRPRENGAEVEFGGRIGAVDTTTSLLTLVNDNRQIYVAPGAEVVQRTEDADVIISLVTIRAGDSVEIKGVSQADGTILASRVRVRIDQSAEDFRAEIEFKTTILGIDYANGTLLTAFCWQVQTDSMTFIFGSRKTEDAGSGSNSGAAAKSGHGEEPLDSTRFRIAFADLKVGDSIEVYGNLLPSGAIYAVAIELEDGAMDARPEVEFTDVIASIDQSTRTVTFVAEGRTAVVDWMADLRGLNYETLNLADFAAGMRVQVKGFVGMGSLISIVRMHRENSI